MTADLLLLLTAIIWGFAFVAQRMGMTHMGPFTFNAIRFSLGSLVLVPVLLWERRRRPTPRPLLIKKYVGPVLLIGFVLFAGASLQQVGLVGTTAGKAGFITGLYVILVPLLAHFWGRRTHIAHWIGALLAVVGLYTLTVRGSFNISPYDLVVFGGAFMWAVHVLLIAMYSAKVGPIRLSILQFAICGLLSAITALFFEPVRLTGIIGGLWPILYGSFLSVGLAYTLQVVAQRRANPSHAVIIMSLEGAFAVLGGWLLLEEILSARDLIGCLLMFGGTLVSQFFGRPQQKVLEWDSG